MEPPEKFNEIKKQESEENLWYNKEQNILRKIINSNLHRCG